MSIIPTLKPQQSREYADKILLERNIDRTKYPVCIIGIRGYFSEMGGTGNDRGIYDDAVFVVSPRSFFSFNANCDPKIFRRGIANLDTGIWYYRVGRHNITKAKELQYPALVQAAPVTVVRDEGPVETGYFGINIHKGGFYEVSSEGCQTIHPIQWPAFMACIKLDLKHYGQFTMPYILMEKR